MSVKKIVLSQVSAFSKNPGATACIIALDGYVGTHWELLLDKVAKEVQKYASDVETIDIATCYHSSCILEEMFRENLPSDRQTDPVLLFGKLYKGTISDFSIPIIREVKRQVSIG